MWDSEETAGADGGGGALHCLSILHLWLSRNSLTLLKYLNSYFLPSVTFIS
jgi:hypothetical protein